MSARRRLLRWASWFAVVNAGPLALIGLHDLWYYVQFSYEIPDRGDRLMRNPTPPREALLGAQEEMRRFYR